MKAIVDKELCTGCGLCTDSCPQVFELSDDKVEVKVDVIQEDAIECSKQAMEDCPLEAIIVEE